MHDRAEIARQRSCFVAPTRPQCSQRVSAGGLGPSTSTPLAGRDRPPPGRPDGCKHLGWSSIICHTGRASALYKGKIS